LLQHFWLLCEVTTLCSWLACFSGKLPEPL